MDVFGSGPRAGRSTDAQGWPSSRGRWVVKSVRSHWTASGTEVAPWSGVHPRRAIVPIVIVDSCSTVKLLITVAGSLVAFRG